MDLSHTIEPKSDQLNADDLMTGSRIITITDVKLNDGDQPVSVRFEGDNNKPYKPCKSMRRVMISLWGKHAQDWIGQSVEIYRDPDVKFGGQAVGGIRISRATGIDKPARLLLTVTRARRAPYEIKPLDIKVKKPATTDEKTSVYPQDEFDADFERMKSAIESGKRTPERIIE